MLMMKITGGIRNRTCLVYTNRNKEKPPKTGAFAILRRLQTVERYACDVFSNGTMVPGNDETVLSWKPGNNVAVMLVRRNLRGCCEKKHN
jgi:hypothetical protein